MRACRLFRSARRRQRGPSFSEAERPERANQLYRYTAERIEKLGVPVKLGVFGADMRIEQVNRGPVTIVYEI